MGTVSDPGGVYIPPGTTPADITSAISSAESDYTVAVNTLNNAIFGYENAKAATDTLATTVLEKRAALEDAQANGTPQEIADAQAEYDQALSELITAQASFNAIATQYKTALTNALNKATTYISALARQQLFTEETSHSGMDSIVNTLLNNPPSAPLSGTDLPTFAWISTMSEDLLTQDITDRSDAAAAILNGFNAYRYLEWQIANSRTTTLTALADTTSAYYDFVRYNTSTYEQTYLNLAASAASSASTTASLTGQREPTWHTLEEALETYEVEYRYANDPFEDIIQALHNFVNDYIHEIQVLEDAEQDALRDALSALQASDEAALATHLEEHPSVAPEISQEAINAIIDEAILKLEGTLSLKYGRNISASSIPELPRGGEPLSMKQLMKLLSQVQLMLQELIRQTADADRWVNTFRLNLAAQNIALYATLLQANDLWDQEVQEADAAYNLEVDTENIELYNTFADIYLKFYDNVDVINGVIDEVNASITAYNQQVIGLVDGANSISSEALAAINAERTDVPYAPNYFDYFQFDADIEGEPPLSSFPDLPYPDALPLFPQINAADLPELPFEYITESNVLETSTIISLNMGIEEFLMQIAPFKERVIDALKTELGITEDSELDLELLFQRDFLEVRDDRDTLDLFEQTTSLIFGFLVQLFFFQRIGIPIKQEEVASLLREVSKFYSLPGSKELEKTVSSPGVSFALAVAGQSERASTVARAINELMGSETFARSILRTLDRLAITAGLEAAGTAPEALSKISVMGIPIEEIMKEQGIDRESLVEKQSMQALAFAYVGQLGINAADTAGLRNDAMAIIQGTPSLQGLSQEEIEELITLLTMLQQMILLLIGILIALQSGVSDSELTASVFGPAAGDDGIAAAFGQLGLTPQQSLELATQVAGRDDLETTLSNLGFDPQTRTILLAIIAASQGKVPLTSGAPGGPAFVDTMISHLKDRGIVLTQDIYSPEFIKDLVAQLEKKASQAQKEALQTALLEPSALEASFTQRLQETVTALQQQIQQPPPTPPREPIEPIAPSQTLQGIVDRFRLLSDDLQKRLIAETSGSAQELGALSDEQRAALLAAIRVGAISAQDALLLATLYAQELAGALSDIETEIIRNLFARPEEDIRRQEEERRRLARVEREERPYNKPALMPPQIVERLKQGVEALFRNTSDAKFAAKVTENFAKTVNRLSDFNDVAVNELLDPAKIIMKQFSIITRTVTDKRQQPQVFLGG